MCRLWITTGCKFNDKQITALNSSLIECLKSGGPDFQNFVHHKNSYSFHSRLAIQDLSSDSNQPYIGNNNSLLVFNGEIFNWPDLYKNLNISDNCKPKSDTQFLSLLIQKNLLEDMISKFKGFFAFVYFDPINFSLLVARDCFGVKPLYYSIIDNKYPVFSSTSEALLKHPLINSNLDPKSIEVFIRYGFFSHNTSPYEDVYQINPGNLLKFNLNESYKFQNINLVKDFGIKTLSFNKPETILGTNFDENYFSKLLEKSCKLRMLSDVPSSLLLSGGIDSSLLALFYSKKLGINLPCFTLQFEESLEGDETNVAKKTAKLLGLEHNILGFDKNTISDSISDVFNSLDQPFIDTSILPTHILCNLISKSYKVAISADGGDESYAGYPKFIRNRSIFSKLKKFRNIPKGFFNFFSESRINNQLFDKAFNSLASDQELFKAIYFQQHQIWKSSIISKLMMGRSTNINQSFYDKFILNKNLSKLSQLQILDLSFYMRDDILYKIDRASMANGLELREPFLDQDIVNYGLLINDECKIYKNKGKNCLRKLIHKELPHLSNLKKKGFGIPEEILNKSEFMKDMFSDCFNKSSKVWDILDKSYVKKLINKNLTSNQSWQLRSLIVWASVKNI